MSDRYSPDYPRAADAGARNRNERICLIVNPQAGAGRAGRQMDVLERAVDRAFEQWEIRKTEGPRHATELAAIASGEGFDLIAAVGGDGTCNEVVSGLFDGDRVRSWKTVFTVIPFGTGSDLIKTMKIPKSLSAALWIAATGITLPSDAGRARVTTRDGVVDRVFINVAGFGTNGEVVLRANQMDKRWGGGLTFLRATIEAGMRYRPSPIALSWEGPDGPGSWEGPLTSAFIGNGAYCGGGMWIGRGGTMQDGYLDLSVIPESPFLRQVLATPALYSGHVERFPGAWRARVTKLTAQPREAVDVHIDLDGEMPGCLPAEFQVLPRALNIRGGWISNPLLNT